MASIPEICTFDADADKIKLTTQTNGDIVLISGLNFDYNQAASLAWLVNQPEETLEVRIRVKP